MHYFRMDATNLSYLDESIGVVLDKVIAQSEYATRAREFKGGSPPRGRLDERRVALTAKHSG